VFAAFGLRRFSAISGPPVGLAIVSGYNASFTTKWAGFHRPFFLVDCF
jgi:hypothetical protein